MSSISGIGQGLYQFAQNLSVGSPTPTGAATSAATAIDSSAAGSTATGSTATSPVQGKGHHHGHGGGFKKIEQAVTAALQAASTNGTSSSSSSDPNQTIQDAIAKIFQNSNASTLTANTTAASDPDGDGDTDAAGAASDSDPQQAFLSTLQSYGIDPQQFHQDFLAAIKEAQGGQVNPSTAFQSFPPGTFVDTIG